MGRLERHLDLQKVHQVLQAHPEIERPRVHLKVPGGSRIETSGATMMWRRDRWPTPAYRAKLVAKRKRRQRTGYAATGR